MVEPVPESLVCHPYPYRRCRLRASSSFSWWNGAGASDSCKTMHERECPPAQSQEFTNRDNSYFEQKIELTLSRPLGQIWPTRIDLWTDPISQRGRRCPAGLHPADTLWHASIDILTYSAYHPSRQSGLCPSGVRSVSTTRGNMRICRTFRVVLKWLRSWKGYGPHCCFTGRTTT